MIQVCSFQFSDQEKFNQALQIRTKVFVEEQHVDKRLEFDGKDPESKHYLALYNNTAVGTARWRKTTYGIKLERFAILQEYRSKKIGQEILNCVLADVTTLKDPIYLNSQKSAIGFYLKNGFFIHGESFFEAEIEHVRMVYLK